MKNFTTKKDMKHVDFKRSLANQMISFHEEEYMKNRLRHATEPVKEAKKEGEKHTIVKYDGKREQKPCFVCQHGRDPPKKAENRIQM